MQQITRRSIIAHAVTLSAAVALTPAAAGDTPSGGGAPAPADFLASLRAASTAPLTRQDYAMLSAYLQVEAEALEAVAVVQGRGTGFDANGRPTILFEPHIFARRTEGRFNTSHPNVSYSQWDAGRYPSTQDGRWAQLAEAYTLAPDDALAATSWGIFQIMGFNHETAGYPAVQPFITDMAKSPQHQLAAWARWLVASELLDEIQRKDWAGFARTYNGPSYAANGYDRRMEEAYARLRTPN